MRAFVTGATGFIGSHVVEALLREGWEVTALSRRLRLPPFLTFREVRWVKGDLADRRRLTTLLRGCDALFHVAAEYRLWSRHAEELYRSNVEGTMNVMAAAYDAGVSKVVYTSSVGALGLTHDGTPADETTPVSIHHMVGHYKRSKFLAEQVVASFVSRGLPVVTVNPSTPIGPRDHKPTPTGKIIVDFLRGHMPAYVDTGLNFIHVADVAVGHLLAFQRGRVGEKYILGAHNTTLKAFFDVLSKVTGLAAPSVRLPITPILALAYVSEAIARFTGSPPSIPLEGVKMSRRHMYFSADKAVQELGLPQQSLEVAVRDAVRWYVQHGYCAQARLPLIR